MSHKSRLEDNLASFISSAGTNSIDEVLLLTEYGRGTVHLQLVEIIRMLQVKYHLDS